MRHDTHKLTRFHMILIGFTLFSMFFGAGNLIFPPFLGMEAGSNMPAAMAGFLVSAVCFPILGVAAVAKSDGLPNLASRVHPRFAFFFTLLIYLCIGPCLAIPRTASTSFEMAVLPFIPSGGSNVLFQAVYSLFFFMLASFLALKPDKLKDRLGKLMTPLLLLLIAVIFIGCILRLHTDFAIPSDKYAASPLMTGFIDGYQTMDTMAALNFGIVIAVNIQSLGITEKNEIARETIKAGLIAGLMLVLVYAGTAYIGALTGSMFSEAENGAQTLTLVVRYLFGNTGIIILGLIFFIACLNVCVGLLCCCSEYFSTVFPRLGYQSWLAVFAVVSLIISNAGLNTILAFSVPLLSMIYPVAIALIILSFLPGKLGRSALLYRVVITVTAVYSIASTAGLV
ncbi:branched-chain amino acid transport system II carrier protein [Clostridium sp. AM58-1XD]|uniref:branched-chain amino acid transport system II carrier protein n=1 Tax=Clostridium sp. AM58-1XD TaxID=2292307 RepID=UPI000E53E49D|nr:branched-chain amino acid transport system II carrier protein [Clostridium sp. AM58-1XD]RGY96564.1 branched-chain amino acid transport system II carrier protein [Clostridium sp. AM58-1XD]